MVQKGQAVFRAVTLGLEEPDRIEVTDGLKEGDEVVTTGASALRDGAKVLLAGRRPGRQAVRRGRRGRRRRRPSRHAAPREAPGTERRQG